MALSNNEAKQRSSKHDTSRLLEYQRHDGPLNILGFWIFLATDLILFACLFATYLVIRTHVDGGPTDKDLFEIPGFTIETLLLLTSSFTGSLAVYEMRNFNKKRLIGWLIVTVLLGIGFVGFEISEFVQYVGDGATMQRSAFLSAFFTLVGTHGAHVSLGIIWMISIIRQVVKFGIEPINARKVFIVGLYWHFLDIVWIFIFSVVYMTGVVS
ncbi:cytochrome aa3 quinol oxidase subunit III [Pullulanibacillus pueri]|uniref:Quinol oxidase subunit 3 n=1 Tax=Pullulanibacillus pueri TaxID=1437324 RepID=A0A8J2ZT23_9BACL|nr:cytochrome aa3 quinol oxidase subunit III [Pullulanibacillus pueri]MBM7680313.1 cytochrome aa3 quinol oxidase subunit III [Pullulanibacillus pueri]GGH75705.1 cytochrome aa3 quinol oxidase subunit III [Pullulanibacillus pueri]